ncbi:MAG: exosortase/archaeosortase family protein [Candidatus Sulfotelmatobacter sp.]
MPSAPDHKSTFESLSLPVFCILGAISLAIWWSPLFSTFALALHDDQYTHILLILPISVALIFMDWKPPEPHIGLSVVLGTVLLIAAASLAFFMKWKAVALSPDERLSASMLALVVWWIAAFILCFGLRASRRALFPLCFLFWMVPFPEFVLNPVVNLLQQGSAAAAHLLFAAAGVPVEQHGVFVHTPGLTVEVARECSSIRSSSMLIVTTMVLAQLLLRSPWRKALIILLAIPLSVAKNGLRIFTIAMLTTRVDPSFLTGRLHREGGVIFFLIALAATFLLLWILRRGEKANHGVRTTRAVSTEL